MSCLESFRRRRNLCFYQLIFIYDVSNSGDIAKDYGDLPQVQCYPQQLNQVFMNLLVNAAQSIEARGEIRIKTRADNGYVEIKASDTGAGIPEIIFFGYSNRFLQPKRSARVRGWV